MSQPEGFGAYTDFGKLRTAIVGSAEGLSLPPFNPTLHHYNDEVQAALRASDDQPLDIAKAMPERWEKTAEQLDSLAALYEANGVKVHRPRPYSEEERLYLAEAQPGASLLYPADPVYTVGKHYLEVNIRRAYRRKEVFPLREIVAPLIAADPEAHHVIMPAVQPLLRPVAGRGPILRAVTSSAIRITCSWGSPTLPPTAQEQIGSQTTLSLSDTRYTRCRCTAPSCIFSALWCWWRKGFCCCIAMN